MPYQSVNPTTGELLQSFIEHSDQQRIDSFNDIAPEKSCLQTGILRSGRTSVHSPIIHHSFLAIPSMRPT
jgi:hypothetical protein